ncbi:unnamed protein product [Effrenium voratum]|uniref:DDE-1 domain-containing protein n=1 Tax=Effrenium voratum TaxID=2562239 RepID=A0AA36MU61_9DINO|nr:unnamed protein product [Effrenium voratum]
MKVRKERRRVACTYCAVICSHPEIQAALPTSVARGYQALPPTRLRLLRGKSSWVTSNTMITILAAVREALQPWLPLVKPILLLDTAAPHLPKRVLSFSKKKGLQLLFVPAWGTSLTQPLDVYGFAAFNLYLRRKYMEQRQTALDGQPVRRRSRLMKKASGLSTGAYIDVELYKQRRCFLSSLQLPKAKVQILRICLQLPKPKVQNLQIAFQLPKAKVQTLQLVGVFREQHCSGQWHFHVATALSVPCRWAGWKRELAKAGYVAHFANMSIDDHSKHRKLQYAYMLRYLWLPSEKKGLSALDKDPLLCCSGGRKHPPLLDAINGALDSAAIEEKVAERFLQRYAAGKQKPAKFADLELWPIVKHLGVQPDDPVLLARLLQHGRDSGNERLLNYLFANSGQIRQKVEMCCALETCDRAVAEAETNAWQRFTSALAQPCSPQISSHEKGVGPVHWRLSLAPGSACGVKAK